MTRNRKILLAGLGVVAVLIASGLGLNWWANQPGDHDVAIFEPDVTAERIVTGLNTRDPGKVPLLGEDDPVLAQQRREAIAGFLPQPGCALEVVSVHDRGQYTKADRATRRIDIEVAERCANGAAPSKRTIGVELIPNMGYWSPDALVS